VSVDVDAVNRALGQYRAYLETFTSIQIDPRLRSEFSLSDVIQETIVEAWRDLERIEALDSDGRKRWLRKLLLHNLIDAVERCRAGKRDVRLKQSLDTAIEESSCRLKDGLAVEDTSPSERLVRQEEGLRVLEAISKLDPRQRDALILQKYHGWTLAQISEHLQCTPGAVAGLHARGLKTLHNLLTEMGISHV
jgi:RNA polymerase sigma-70 factor (subfamily 1)